MDETAGGREFMYCTVLYCAAPDCEVLQHQLQPVGGLAVAYAHAEHHGTWSSMQYSNEQHSAVHDSTVQGQSSNPSTCQQAKGL